MHKKNPEEVYVPKNNEISISYAHKAENGIEIILFFIIFFQVVLDIIQNDEDLEPQEVKEY